MGAHLMILINTPLHKSDGAKLRIVGSHDVFLTTIIRCGLSPHGTAFCLQKRRSHAIPWHRSLLFVLRLVALPTVQLLLLEMWLQIQRRHLGRTGAQASPTVTSLTRLGTPTSGLLAQTRWQYQHQNPWARSLHAEQSCTFYLQLQQTIRRSWHSIQQLLGRN